MTKILKELQDASIDIEKTNGSIMNSGLHSQQRNKHYIYYGHVGSLKRLYFYQSLQPMAKFIFFIRETE